jgi:hypothetical protein
VHSSTNKSPYEIILGYKTKTLPETLIKSTVEGVEERLNDLMKMRKEVSAAHELAQQKMRERITHKFEGFKKGDLVWLEGTNLKIGYLMKKLVPKQEGPFAIKEVILKLAYKLQLQVSWRIHDVFHTCYLTPYRMTEEYGPQEAAPPPDLISGDEEYEVEVILNHKGKPRRCKYLVACTRYNDHEWMTEGNFMNTCEILEAYKKKNNL